MRILVLGDKIAQDLLAFDKKYGIGIQIVSADNVFSALNILWQEQFGFKCFVADVTMKDSIYVLIEAAKEGLNAYYVGSNAVLDMLSRRETFIWDMMEEFDGWERIIGDIILNEFGKLVYFDKNGGCRYE